MKIAVLMGGTSNEREISLKSGKAISQALRGNGHSVLEIDPQQEYVNKLLLEKVDLAFIALHGKPGENGVEETAPVGDYSDAVVSRRSVSSCSALPSPMTTLPALMGRSGSGLN